jgi:hypothetical protein
MSGRGFQRELAVDLRIRRGLAVRASGTAGLGASPQSLVDNALEGAGASATFSAATETAIDLLGVARKAVRGADSTADIVVAEDVAGTNNHEAAGPALMQCPSDIQDRGAMQKEKPSFQMIPK